MIPHTQECNAVSTSNYVLVLQELPELKARNDTVSIELQPSSMGWRPISDAFDLDKLRQVVGIVVPTGERPGSFQSNPSDRTGDSLTAIQRLSFRDLIDALNGEGIVTGVPGEKMVNDRVSVAALSTFTAPRVVRRWSRSIDPSICNTHPAALARRSEIEDAVYAPAHAARQAVAAVLARLPKTTMCVVTGWQWGKRARGWPRPSQIVRHVTTKDGGKGFLTYNFTMLAVLPRCQGFWVTQSILLDTAQSGAGIQMFPTNIAGAAIGSPTGTLSANDSRPPEPDGAEAFVGYLQQGKHAVLGWNVLNGALRPELPAGLAELSSFQRDIVDFALMDSAMLVIGVEHDTRRGLRKGRRWIYRSMKQKGRPLWGKLEGLLQTPSLSQNRIRRRPRQGTQRARPARD